MARRGSRFWFLAGLVGVGLIGTLERLAGFGVLTFTLYLVPVAAAAWFSGRRQGIAVAIAAGLLEFLSATNGPRDWFFYANEATQMGVILACAQGLGRLRERTALAAARSDELFRLQETLREREATLRMALEAGRIVVWEWDLATDTIQYSENARALARGDNLDPYSTLTGLLQAVHVEDREALGQAAGRTRGQGVAFDCEYRVLMQDGTYRWIQSTAEVVQREHGKPTRVLGVSHDVTERKQAEEALKAARDRLELRVKERTQALELAIAELSTAKERMRVQLAETPALLYSGRPEMPPRPAFVSENIRSLLGFEPEEVTRDPGFWIQQVHPDDAAGVERSFAALMRDGYSVWEYRLRNKAGRYLWLRDHVRLIRHVGGQPTELVGCAIDITERREAEQSLRTRESELRTLVENSHDFIVRVDAEGRLVYANPAMARLYGRQPEEVLGKRLRDLDLPSAVWQPARATFERVLRTGREATVELAQEFDGNLRYFEARYVPELAPGGQIASVLVVAREATERKRVEEALREAEMRARALADAAFEGIVIHEAGTILEANEVAAQFFGTEPAEMVGVSLLQFVAPPHREAVRDALLTVDSRCHEATGLKRDGTAFPLELQSRRFPYRGRSVGVTAVRDLTLSHEARERIQALQAGEALKREQAQRESFARQLILAQEAERERIAAGLHDGLGQNVLVMKHEAQRGLREPVEPARMRESLTAVAALAGQSVNDIRGIVRHLHPYLLKQLGLTRALRAMIDTLNQSSTIRFTCDVQLVDGLLPPESELAFYRVLQECLNNVVKHSQAAAARLEVRGETGRLVASVWDDGRGFNLDDVFADKGEHAGLGVRSLVERVALLGGSSRFVTRPGQGTRVELQIPLPPSPPAA